MSGTSLDGLDIAFCEFEKSKKWKYRIGTVKTIKYNNEWKEKLSSAFKKSKKEISQQIGRAHV